MVISNQPTENILIKQLVGLRCPEWSIWEIFYPSGLKAKATAFKVTFDWPQAARTSNAVDRLMNYRAPSSLCHAVFPWNTQVRQSSH
jgi:hypothetical protein